MTSMLQAVCAYYDDFIAEHYDGRYPGGHYIINLEKGNRETEVTTISARAKPKAADMLHPTM